MESEVVPTMGAVVYRKFGEMELHEEEEEDDGDYSPSEADSDDSLEWASETERTMAEDALAEGTVGLDFFPTFCGSAFKNKGVQLVLNAVVDYLPNPTEVPPQPEIDIDGNETGELAIVDPDRPLRALAFKIMSDPFVGTLTFARVYSGVIEKGSSVLNSVKGKKARARCEDGKPPGDHAPSQSVRPPCLRSGLAACSK